MANGSPAPGPRGDLSPVTAPDHFPLTTDSKINKTLPSQVIFSGSSVAESYSSDYPVGQCEGFTVYAMNSSGDWNVQFSPDSNNPESGWVNAAGTDKTGDDYIATTSRHPHVRVVLRAGFSGYIWLYRKYATY